MKGNEQIELQAQRYLYERAHLSGSCVVTTFDPFDLEQAFIGGAEWQKQQMIDKVCEWINLHIGELSDIYTRSAIRNEFLEDFRKAMEG